MLGCSVDQPDMALSSGGFHPRRKGRHQTNNFKFLNNLKCTKSSEEERSIGFFLQKNEHTELCSLPSSSIILLPSAIYNPKQNVSQRYRSSDLQKFCSARKARADQWNPHVLQLQPRSFFLWGLRESPALSSPITLTECLRVDQHVPTRPLIECPWQSWEVEAGPLIL